MIRKCSVLFALWLWAALPGVAAEIRGKVTDAQGAAVANVSILVQGPDSASAKTALSGADGGYVLGNLSPGAYTLRAKKDGYVETAQGPMEVLGTSNLVVDFHLSPVRQTEEVRGAEERNPNDFVILLDTNAIQNEIARAGTILRYIPEFRADRSYYGEQFGQPLRREVWATPSQPLFSFHGSLYEMHQDYLLNARPFFQVGSLKPSRRNQYGFSVAAPLLRERMFFDFAWGQVKDSGFVNGNVQVPLPEERQPRSSNPEVKAILARLLKAYPDELPNRTEFTPRHLNTNAPRDIDSTAFSLHWDFRFNPTDRLAYDQKFQDYTEEPFELVIGQNPRTLLRPQSYHLSYYRDFSTRTVVQVRFNYDRFRALLLPTVQYQNLLAPLGIRTVPDIDLGGEITNIGMIAKGMPRWRFENHFLFSPQISHVQGNHSFSAGFSMKRFQDNDLRSSFSRGEIIFTNDFGRTAVDNFLHGTFTRMSLSVGEQYQGFRWREYGLYFHDRFKVRPDFTLNFGIRYEIHAVPHEVNHLTQFFYKTDANNFAPQFGFAWNPGMGKTLIRGGYGISFGDIPLAGFSRQRSNPPTVQQVVLQPTIEQPDIDLRILQNPPPEKPTPGGRASKSLLGPNLVVPYSHIYNLAMEQELPGNTSLRIAYLGSRTFKILTGAVFNRAELSTTIENTSRTVNARRPDKTVFRFYNIINNSIAYQDAVRVSVNKRISSGFAFEANYTFSKVMDTSGYDFADYGSARDVSQTVDIFRDMKSRSRFDTPHSFSISYSYDLPFFRNGSRGIFFLLRRWTVSGTTIFRSGTPLPVFTGSDAPGFGNVDGEDGDRPNILNPSLLGTSFDNPDTVSSLLYYDPTNKTKPPLFDPKIPVGGRGNLGYNAFRKDGMNNWNLALGRNFSLGGGRAERRLQFRAEFFNFFNHAQFRAPGNLVSSPTFGKITDTENKGRVTQLTLKLLF